MSFKNSSQVRVYIGAFAVGPELTQVSTGMQVEALDSTTITQVADRTTAGLRNDEVTVAGIFDSGTTGLHQAVAGNIGGTAQFITAYGSATGAIAYAGTALLTRWAPESQVSDLVRQEASISVDGTVQRGTMLAIEVAGPTSTGGDVDLIAPSTANGTVYFVVTDMTGSGKLFLQQSTGGNGTGYTSVGTFVLASGTVQATAIASTGSAGTMFRYARFQGSGTGTPTVTAMLVRPGATY
tara:strand:- start:292 stop:1008 length:717 start_codon:yes stop_codon:yes gene_type:complete